MKYLTVKAAKGLCVPMEDDPRRHIGADPVTVPDRAYYRRLLNAGDLTDATPEAVAPATNAETEATATATTTGNSPAVKKKRQESRE